LCKWNLFSGLPQNSRGNFLRFFPISMLILEPKLSRSTHPLLCHLNVHFRAPTRCCEIRDAHKLYVNAIVIDTNLISEGIKMCCSSRCGCRHWKWEIIWKNSGGWKEGEKRKTVGQSCVPGICILPPRVSCQWGVGWLGFWRVFLGVNARDNAIIYMNFTGSLI